MSACIGDRADRKTKLGQRNPPDNLKKKIQISVAFCKHTNIQCSYEYPQIAGSTFGFFPFFCFIFLIHDNSQNVQKHTTKYNNTHKRAQRNPIKQKKEIELKKQYAHLFM